MTIDTNTDRMSSAEQIEMLAHAMRTDLEKIRELTERLHLDDQFDIGATTCGLESQITRLESEIETAIRREQRNTEQAMADHMADRMAA